MPGDAETGLTMGTDDEEMEGHMRLMLAKIREGELLQETRPPTPSTPTSSMAVPYVSRAPPSPPRTGMVIRDTWELMAPLGKGGFGLVFEARHRALERTDAIKFLHLHFADDDEIRRRFHDEAKTMARLRGEHLVQVHDFGTHEGLPYFVMERLVGEPLQSLIARESPLGSTGFLPLAKGILRGLVEVHSHGIVHRDLKPANIFVEADHRVKILDFGLAKTSLHITSHNLNMGTPVYMAPELLFEVDARASVATDIYSVGVVLYQLLTGHLPFHLDQRAGLGELLQQLLNATLEPPVVEKSEPLPAASDLVLRALDRNPARRPETAAAFLEGLMAADRVTSSAARRPSHRRQERSSLGPPLESRLPHYDATEPSYFYLSFSYHDEATVAPLVAAAGSSGSLLWVGTGGRPSEVSEMPMRAAIEGALGVVVIASPQAKQSVSVADEVTLTLAMGKPVILVWLEGTDERECIDPRLQEILPVDARALDVGRIGHELRRALARCARTALPACFTLSAAALPPRTRRKGGLAEVSVSRRRLFPPPGYVFVEDPRATDGTRGLCILLEHCHTMRALLDEVFLGLLVGRHRPYSYGKQWMLAEVPDDVAFSPLVALPWWWPSRRATSKEDIDRWTNENRPVEIGIDAPRLRWRVRKITGRFRAHTVAGNEPLFFDYWEHYKARFLLLKRGVLEHRPWASFRDADYREKRCYELTIDAVHGESDMVSVQTGKVPEAKQGPPASMQDVREWMMRRLRFGG
jgi:serine/threonine protein kinase